MTTKFMLGLIGAGMLTLTGACARDMPAGPSALNSDGSAAAASALTTSSTPGETPVSSTEPKSTTSSTEGAVVYLQADGTAYPAVVTVWARQTVLMVNNSSRHVSINSYNCTQFSSMGLEPGASRHTMPFYPAGKTCDYSAYDGYPKKIFEGQVKVQ